jgi:hypothetical protein
MAHRLAAGAELVAARAALAHGDPATALLARAAIEATRARELDPTDALAWVTSAEIEQLCGASACSRDGASAAADRARSFVERASQIDPLDAQVRALSDALAAGGAGDAGAGR